MHVYIDYHLILRLEFDCECKTSTNAKDNNNTAMIAPL